jgi:hypothetical protein
VTAILISCLILLSGMYFSYRWNEEKAGIRTLAGQMEQAIKIYLEKNKKGS